MQLQIWNIFLQILVGKRKYKQVHILLLYVA